MMKMKWWRCKNPFFRKVTYMEHSKTLFIYSFGCNWACSVCTYRIKDPCDGENCKEIPKNKIMELIEEYYRSGKAETVKFLGGEPLINPHLSIIAKFAMNLGLRVGIGHTNLSIMPPEGVESAVVSIKAISEDLHRKYTRSFSNKGVLENFGKCYRKGIALKTNTVLVPKFVDVDEVERIAEFVASIDDNIPFHIIGYMPVPSFPWKRPTIDELKTAAIAAKKHLKNVTWSRPSIKEISYPSKRVL